jgi:hypothetical protein
MFEQLRRRMALKRALGPAISSALQEHTDNFLKGTMLRSLSGKGKREIAEAFYGRVMEIDKEPEPFMTFRDQFAAAGLAWANLEVLTLKPNELEGMFVSPHISGELHARIRDAAKYDDWIASVCARPEAKTDDEAVYAAVQGQTVINLYWLNGFNLLRVKYEPWSLKEKPDWFRPFARSMLIWAEYFHRDNLGMPLLCSDLLALEHNTFANFVRNGERQPLAAWEAHYGHSHEAVQETAEQPLEHS